MKKILSVLICVILILGTCSMSISAKSETQLKFNENGKFRILVLADIQDNTKLSSLTARFIKDAINDNDPDLIVLLGDNISGTPKTMKDTEKAIDSFMSILDKFGIPVAMVFGNHDSSKVSKEKQLAVYEKYPCFIGEAGADVTGVGNYNKTILSSDGSKVAFNLFFIDSLTKNENHPAVNEYYKENDVDGYAAVHKDQIEWYKNTAETLKEQNGGEAVPSFVFQHIVVPEIFDAIDKTSDGNYALREGSTGFIGEAPCPPEYNNGEFDAMKNEGDVLAMFFGHDHVNGYVIPHKGIDLVCTPGVGFYSYGDQNRGARIIDIDENDPTHYDTKLISIWEKYNCDSNAYNRAVFIYQAKEYSFIKKLSAIFTMLMHPADFLNNIRLSGKAC